MNSANNIKIAKNTLIIYVGQVVTIVIQLMTSRFVLQALGASDYGLYNVVGGVIAMFAFISASMSATTTRFINYEMGKVDGDVNRIFNQSKILHIILAILVFILLETIGCYYINNYLNVAVGKEDDAMMVFQISTMVTCLGIICVPYQSLFNAHEDFFTMTIVGMVSTLLKLIIAVSILFYAGNALLFYAWGMSLITLLTVLFCYVLSKKKWPEIVRWRLVTDIRSYKEQLFYANWNILRTMALVGRNQGSAMLINLFYGTAVNAAYAIASTVSVQVNNFVGKFDTAVAPQVTQNLGRKNIERSIYLASHTCRLCILLMEVVFFPLYIDLDFILHLWLGKVPEGTLIFCQYTLMIVLIASTSGGLIQLIYGTGKIKWFTIQILFWNSIPMVLGYIMFSVQFPPYVLMLLFVIADILNRTTQFYLLRKLMAFDVVAFVKEAYARPLLIFILMSLFTWLYSQIEINTTLLHLTGIIIAFLITTCLCVTIGLRNGEKELIFSRVKNIHVLTPIIKLYK